MKIIFLGTSEFAIPALDALIHNNLAPIAIITSPDRPAGRKLELQQSPIKKYCSGGVLQNNTIEMLQPDSIDENVINHIKSLSPDVGVVVSYGKILPKQFINVFPKGILNIHPSLLPKYRGPAPLENTILNGDTNAGVSIIAIDEKMDHGDIVAQEKVQISEITYTELHDLLALKGGNLLVVTIQRWVDGDITAEPQDDAMATFTKMLKKEDGNINWSLDAKYIERMTRAYNPWPGTYTYIKSGTQKTLIKIKKAEVLQSRAEKKVGTIFEDNGFPAIVCGSDSLKLLIIQPEGKKEMTGSAYLTGHPEMLHQNV